MRRRVTLNPAFLVKASPPGGKLAAVVHAATFERFDAVQFVVTSPVDTCQVITAVVQLLQPMLSKDNLTLWSS